MFRLLFLLPCLVISYIALSQNLIPNPGFELNSGVPTDVGQLSLCSDWGNAGSTTESSDYFHESGGLTADLPITPVANVSAFQGNAIIGFKACGKLGSDQREYIDVQLTEPLEVGKKYKFTFNITNGTVHNYSFGGYATDKIGIAFSTSRLNQVTDEPLNVIPDCVIDEVFFSRLWETMTFYHTATEASEWLTLGVFGDDSDKLIEFKEGEFALAENAYYFLDSFSLKEHEDTADSLPIERESDGQKTESIQSNFPFFVPNAFTPDGDGNNDTFEVISSKQGIEFTVVVFDRWGNVIYTAENGFPEWDGRCKDSICPPDVYVWLIKYTDVDENDNVVEKESTGSIHLIR